MLSDDLTRIDSGWMMGIGFDWIANRHEYVMRVVNNIGGVYYINFTMPSGSTFGCLLSFSGESDDGVDPIVPVESKTYVNRGDVRRLLDALGVTTEADGG